MKLNHLKSNMDRFIEIVLYSYSSVQPNLKSNMDRFIETSQALLPSCPFHLKSNMDRFIVVYSSHTFRDLKI